MLGKFSIDFLLFSKDNQKKTNGYKYARTKKNDKNSFYKIKESMENADSALDVSEVTDTSDAFSQNANNSGTIGKFCCLPSCRLRRQIADTYEDTQCTCAQQNVRHMTLSSGDVDDVTACSTGKLLKIVFLFYKIGKWHT